MTNEFISVFKIPAHDHRFNQAERQHCYLLNCSFRRREMLRRSYREC